MKSWEVLHGDVWAVLPQLEKIDLSLKTGKLVVITDPPYGDRHSYGVVQKKRKSGRFRRVEAIVGDDDLRAMIYVHDFCKDRKINLACFYSPFSLIPMVWKSVLVWVKGEHTGASGPGNHRFKRDFEMIGVNSYGKLNGKWDSGVVTCHAIKLPKSGHFCEKPIPLMRFLVRKLSDPGDVIFDPFCGSGSTGVAAVEEGRRFLGLEIDARWVPVARNRLSQTRRIRTLC